MKLFFPFEQTFALTIIFLIFIYYFFIKTQNFKIDGYAKEGYEEIKEIYRQYFLNGVDDHSQLVIFVDNQKVVDLCGKIVEN